MLPGCRRSARGYRTRNCRARRATAPQRVVAFNTRLVSFRQRCGGAQRTVHSGHCSGRRTGSASWSGCLGCPGAFQNKIHHKMDIVLPNSCSRKRALAPVAQSATDCRRRWMWQARTESSPDRPYTKHAAMCITRRAYCSPSAAKWTSGGPGWPGRPTRSTHP